jgi:hypothetical protein
VDETVMCEKAEGRPRKKTSPASTANPTTTTNNEALIVHNGKAAAAALTLWDAAQ